MKCASVFSVLAALAWFSCGVSQAQNQPRSTSTVKIARPKTAKELQAEIDRLSLLVKQLTDQLKAAYSQPTIAAPINLGRTSLAAVNASSVNGDRDLANQYYGVPNAFDNGENWLNGINYTYWLGGGEPTPWIEVSFAVPVTITSINVEGGLPFATQLFLVEGGEEDFPENRSQLILDKPRQHISRVRLNFKGAGGGQNQVNEIRVLGYVPPQVKYEPQTPHVLPTPQNALAIARSRFEEWRNQILLASPSNVNENSEEYSVIFKDAARNLDIFRVVINKKTGAVSSQSLVELAPLK